MKPKSCVHHCFLNFFLSYPTEEDIRKAELILEQFLKLRKIGSDAKETIHTLHQSYCLGISTYQLIEILIGKEPRKSHSTSLELIPTIIKHCSNSVITNIADNLKILLLSFPKGFEPFLLPSNKIEYLNNAGDNLSQGFKLLFRDFLKEKTRQQPVEALHLLEKFATDECYHPEFFRQVVVFVIGENWAATKALFWQLLSTPVNKFLFSSDDVQEEIHELLRKNCHQLNTDDIEFLQVIIDEGPFERDRYSFH